MVSNCFFSNYFLLEKLHVDRLGTFYSPIRCNGLLSVYSSRVGLKLKCIMCIKYIFECVCVYVCMFKLYMQGYEFIHK